MKLLHLDSSIMGANSISRTVSAAAVARLQSEIGDLDVTYRDLAADPLGHLTLADLGSEEGSAVLEQFLAADIVVIGAGFYNFTVPTQLKAWIDRILIVGRTFRYTEQGPEGLVKGKRIIVALSRGGVYGDGSPIAQYEHAEKLLRTAFGFIGIYDPQFIIAEGVARGEEVRAAALASALVEAGHITVAQPAA